MDDLREQVQAGLRGPRRASTLAITLTLGFLVGAGLLFAWRSAHPGPGARGATPKILAVLPFDNIGDSADAYLADGITDELRGALARLPAVQVIARGSSNQYRRSTKVPQTIARELGADYLLTATVQWVTDANGTRRVRVSPELVDVTSGYSRQTTWKRSFDTTLADAFQIQADIAAQVAAALDVAPGGGQPQARTERPTPNLAAYDAFLRAEAQQALVFPSPTRLRAAIGYYEQAVALDSTFALAWARLARAQASLYANAAPTPQTADAAKRAADRAVALAPDRPESQLALGDYREAVVSRFEDALAAYEAGLRAAPDNADLLTGAALAEQGLGRWDAAYAHLERARVLDPRSVTTARRLAHTLVRLRRYPDALAAADRGLAMAPENLDLIENKAMAYIAQGDSMGARGVVRAAPTEVEPTALVGHFANYWDIGWVLDEDQQQLLLRLPPSAYDGDRGTWGAIRAQTYYLRGDVKKARTFADSGRLGYEQTLTETPDDAQLLVFRGLMLAYLGRKAEAIREGERAVALAVSDGYGGPYIRQQLVRIYMIVGEPEQAIDELEPLLKMPYFLSPGWLRIDPNFAPLRGRPRFERLANGK